MKRSVFHLLHRLNPDGIFPPRHKVMPVTTSIKKRRFTVDLIWLGYQKFLVLPCENSLKDPQDKIHFEPWTDRISLKRFDAIDVSDIRRIIDDHINTPSFDPGATEVGVSDEDHTDAEINVTESDEGAKVTEASSDSEINVPVHIEEDGSRPGISGDVVEEESFEEEDGDEDDAQEEMSSG